MPIILDPKKSWEESTLADLRRRVRDDVENTAIKVKSAEGQVEEAYFKGMLSAYESIYKDIQEPEKKEESCLATCGDNCS